jgi:glycosyltransferase involved in cell wall biosynthesis
LKVVLYYPWIHLYGGIERVIVELVTRSRHEWRVFTNHYEPANTFPEFGNIPVTELARVSVDRSLPAVLRAAWRIGRQRIPTDGCDALLVMSDGLGDLVTFRNRRVPIVAFCHTPLRAVFDPVYREHALGERGPLGRAALRAAGTVFQAVDRRAWGSYAGVLVNSREVRKRILTGGLYEDGPRLRVCHPGVDCKAFSGEVAYEPMVLAPGRIMWTKNLELAIEAFRRATLPAPWKLVVAGFLDRKSRPYLEKLRQMALGAGQIEFILSPDEAHLRDLYRLASVVLFPPLNEDWGLVPLEAMASAKPVLATARGGPTESILDGQTGFLLEPDPDRWAAVIQQLSKDPRLCRQIGEHGRQHAREFDWSEFTATVDSTLERWTA